MKLIFLKLFQVSVCKFTDGNSMHILKACQRLLYILWHYKNVNSLFFTTTKAHSAHDCYAGCERLAVTLPSCPLCVVGRAHPSSSQLFGSTRQQDPSRPHPPQGLCQHVEGQPPCPIAWGGSQACPRLQPKRRHPTKSCVRILSG